MLNVLIFWFSVHLHYVSLQISEMLLFCVFADVFIHLGKKTTICHNIKELSRHCLGRGNRKYHFQINGLEKKPINT